MYVDLVDFSVSRASYNLEARTIGMCQVLRSLLRARIINDLDPLFVSVIEEKRELKSIHLHDAEFRKQELSWLVGTAQRFAVEEGR